MLEIKDIEVSYGGIVALRRVSLSIQRGKMVALIGPNGAGKSSLLNAISRIVKPTGGSIAFDGQPLHNSMSHAVARLGILQVPEGRQIFGPMTVEENLAVGKLAAGKRSRGDRSKVVYDAFPILFDKRSQLGQTLSGGQQQMLAIGRALMGYPEVLLLDEPSLGLSPKITGEVFAGLKALNADGLTMLVVEQNARQALAATSYAYVIEGGRIVHQGVSGELASSKEIIEHYLGVA